MCVYVCMYVCVYVYVYVCVCVYIYIYIYMVANTFWSQLSQMIFHTHTGLGQDVAPLTTRSANMQSNTFPWECCRKPLTYMNSDGSPNKQCSKSNSRSRKSNSRSRKSRRSSRLWRRRRRSISSG